MFLSCLDSKVPEVYPKAEVAERRRVLHIYKLGMAGLSLTRGT